MQMQGDESNIHAALKFKLSLIAQGKPMPRPANVTDMVGQKGSSKKG